MKHRLKVYSPSVVITITKVAALRRGRVDGNSGTAWDLEKRTAEEAYDQAPMLHKPK